MRPLPQNLPKPLRSSTEFENTPSLQDRWIHKVQPTCLRVTRKAIDAFRLYVSTQCRLQIDLPQKAEINGDPFELEILVLNLLRNAADAVEPLKDKSLIKLSVASEDGDWVLSITDNGPPVPDEVLERMKKALQNSLKADGLGLGLKIVFAIAERHRVELNFSRVDPQGLRAEIRFKKVSQ